MTSFLNRLIVNSLSIIIGSLLLFNVSFGNLYQIIIIGIISAITSHILSLIILCPETYWADSGVDLCVTTTIIYFLFPVFPGIQISIIGSFLIGVISASFIILINNLLIIQ